MLTFVLVLFLHGGTATQIPGYGSEYECRAAGGVALKDVGPGWSADSRPFVLGYTCVPGPRRN